MTACSELRERLGVDPAGSASAIRSWLLLEVAGSWPEGVRDDAFAAALPPERHAQLKSLWVHEQLRPLVIRRPGRAGRVGTDEPVLLVGSTVGGRWLERLPARALADLDLQAVAAGRPGHGEPVDGPLFAVCTNGSAHRHDDRQNALLPLLELGVRPVGSAGIVGDDGAGKFRRTEGFDTSGITFTGAFLEPNLEKVASLSPDLVVGYEFDDKKYDDLSKIAPTVLVQIFERPLSEALLEFGDLVGKKDEALAMQEEYEERIASLRERLGDRADTLSVAVLGPNDPGTFGRGDAGQAIGTVMDDLGLPRPAAQLADDGETSFSLEEIGTRSADVVLVLDFSGDGRDAGLKALLDSPTYQRLPAVQAGQAHVVDGTTTVGAAWARMGAFRDVLEQRLVPAKDDVVVES